MKKLTALLLALCLALSMAGCGASAKNDKEDNAVKAETSKDDLSDKKDKKDQKDTNDKKSDEEEQIDEEEVSNEADFSDEEELIDEEEEENDTELLPTADGNEIFVDAATRSSAEEMTAETSELAVDCHIETPAEDNVQFVFQGMTELDGNQWGRTDLTIDGETVYEFYTNPANECFLLTDSGEVAFVGQMPLQDTSVYEDAMAQLGNMAYGWDEIDMDDTYANEENYHDYYRIKSENYSSPDEYRDYLSTLFTEEKAEEVYTEAIKLWEKKDGAYYATDSGNSLRDWDFCLLVNEPVLVSEDRIELKQRVSYYDRNEEDQVIGVHEEAVYDCVMVKEADGWRFAELEVPNKEEK